MFELSPEDRPHIPNIPIGRTRKPIWRDYSRLGNYCKSNYKAAGGIAVFVFGGVFPNWVRRCLLVQGLDVCKISETRYALILSKETPEWWDSVPPELRTDPFGAAYWLISRGNPIGEDIMSALYGLKSKIQCPKYGSVRYPDGSNKQPWIYT